MGLDRRRRVHRRDHGAHSGRHHGHPDGTQRHAPAGDHRHGTTNGPAGGAGAAADDARSGAEQTVAAPAGGQSTADRSRAMSSAARVTATAPAALSRTILTVPAYSGEPE